MASAVSGGASQASRQRLIWSRLRLSITNLDLIVNYVRSSVHTTKYEVRSTYYLLLLLSHSKDEELWQGRTNGL